MCRFCVEHGEGERWYLNAKNYSYDLQSDIKRRDYIVDFISGFGDARKNAITWLERAEKIPAPLARAAKSLASAHMQRHHFGQPLPKEECRQIFNIATSITVIPCICRMHTPGKRAEEVCILITTQPVEPYLEEGFKGYENGPELDDFHKVDAQEAMRIIEQSEERGLMHSVWTFETPFTAAICNCNLESGCMAMKLTAGYEMKLMWRGESVIQLDAQRCVACGACAELCPFSALEQTGGVIAADASRCWGCGICRAGCSQDALTLVDRRTVPAVASLW